jgi:hypothetical protein
MDNREHRESSAWVSACAELLSPPAEWEPDLRLARARLAVRADARARRGARRGRIVLLAAAAMLAAVILVPVIPQTHVLAQRAAGGAWQHLEQLWYWLTIIRHGPMVMGRFAEATAELRVQQVAGPKAVADAGFTPRLPAAGTLSAEPSLSAQGPMSFEARWNGTRLTLDIGPTVIARWSGVSDGRTKWSQLTLVQGRAEATTPPGFDRSAFAAAFLRAAGLRNPDAIDQLAAQPVTVPALLFGYRSPHRFLGVRDVPLSSGTVTMIEEGEPDGQDLRVAKLNLLWSAEGRTYLLSGVPKTSPGAFSVAFAPVISGAISVVSATAPPAGGPPPHRVLYRVPPGNR